MSKLAPCIVYFLCLTFYPLSIHAADVSPLVALGGYYCKMEAIQRAQQAENEVREARAQAAKAVAKAEGEAKADQVLAASISPSLIQWRQLEITQQAVAKWNGARPMVEGQGSGLLLQLPAMGSNNPLGK